MTAASAGPAYLADLGRVDSETADLLARVSQLGLRALGDYLGAGASAPLYRGLDPDPLATIERK